MSESMDKATFFKGAMQAGRYRDKNWILQAFTVTRPQEANDTSVIDVIKPYDIHRVANESGTVELYFYNSEKESVELSDFSEEDNEPIFDLNDTLVIGPEEVENLSDEQVTTRYGNLLANYILLIEPFGSKIPYKNKRFSIKEIEKEIERRLTSEPVDGEDYEPDRIYVKEYNRFRRAAGLIDGLTQLCVPSASPKTLTTHPDIKRRRSELVEQYRDRLHDPTVISYIEQELRKLDAEHLEGDVSQGFYIKKKTLDPGRKKSHLMMGLEEAFGDPDVADLVINSLAEGIDVEKLPAMINSLREGSFDRGHQTMLGGVVSKTVLRVMQNTKIVEKDCGSKLGIQTPVTSSNRDELIGNYILENEEVVELTQQNIDGYVGSTVTLRTPLFCRSGEDDFCQTCIGRRYEGHERALATAASTVGSTFMSIFMASAHAKALETTTYDPRDHLQ